MTHTAYFTAQRLRATALLFALVFFAGQTFAQQHLHVDDAPTASCVLCVQGDTAAVAQALPLIVIDWLIVAGPSGLSTQRIFTTPRDTNPARAPPRT